MRCRSISPRSVGYYGGLALAVSAGIIEPPLGVFIAAIPLVKMLNNRGLPTPARFVAQLLDGAAKPVGSTGQGTIRLDDQQEEQAEAEHTAEQADEGHALKQRKTPGEQTSA